MSQGKQHRSEVPGLKSCGFVGLGVMGLPMARNLLRGGYQVTVYNRTSGRTDDLVSEGAFAAATAGEVAERSQVVLTCLSTPAAVTEVVFGQGGILERSSPGTIYVDHSTIDPETARIVAQRCAEHEVVALDAPVSGGEKGAIDGTLSIMVGGDEAAFRRVSEVLNVIGSTVRHVGPPGAGQTVKAANQMIVGGTIGIVAEALLLLETQDVALGPALEVLRAGLAGSAVLEAKGSRMLARDFTPGGRASLQLKDLAIAVGLAHQAGVPVPITALVTQLYEAMSATGRADLDHGGLFAVLEDLAGGHPS